MFLITIVIVFIVSSLFLLSGLFLGSFSPRQENEVNPTNNPVKRRNQLLSIEFYPGSYIASVYFDERVNSIRLFGVFDDKMPQLKCILNYDNSKKECHCEYYDMMIVIKTYNRIVPSSLLLNNISLSIPPIDERKPIYKLSGCFSNMLNYTSAYQLIQTLESYRFFGVEHFTIYKTTVSNQVQRVLDYYEKMNIVEVITWNPKLEFTFTRGSQFYGIIGKINDCFYRNRKISLSLVQTDLDEIIWPAENESLLQLIKRYDNGSRDVYIFRSFLYHRDESPEDNYINDVQDTDIFQYHQYCIFKPGHVVKMIIFDSSKIEHLFLHYVTKSLRSYTKIWLPPEIGHIRHTRRAKPEHLGFCESEWLIEKVDPRQQIIQNKVKTIQDKLNIVYPQNEKPTIFSKRYRLPTTI